MNTLNHITKVKIYEIQSFLDIPRKLSPLETLHIAFQSHNINFIYNNMTPTEQTTIEYLISNPSSPIRISEELKNKCRKTDSLGFIYKTPIGDYIVDPIYLNKMNEHIFSGLYQDKPLEVEGRELLADFQQLDKELFKTIEKTQLKDYLNTLKSKEIQDILKFHQFTNASKLKKADAIKLIHDTFFKDYTLLEYMLKNFNNSSLFIFHSIYESGKNYDTNIDIAETMSEHPELTSVSELFNHAFIFNYNKRYNIVSIPNDALDYIKKYIQSQNGLESFIDEQLQRIGTEKDEIFESLAENTMLSEIDEDLSEFDGLVDWDEMDGSLPDLEDDSFDINDEDFMNELEDIENIETYLDPEIRQNLVNKQLNNFKNDPKKQTSLNIYIAITNLYGYASLERTAYLMKHLYSRDMTEKDIKDEIEAMDIKELIIVQNDMLLHPVIPMLMNSDEIDDPLQDFYEPNTLDELLTYVNNEYFTRDNKLQQFIKFLRNNIKGDDVEKEQSVRYILFHLRIAPDEAHAVEMMKNLIKENKLLPIPDKKLSKQIEKGWTHLRLWSLRGYTVNEIKSL